MEASDGRGFKMIKIMVTVRNRLAITKKCIEAICRHTTIPFQLFVYDNNTNYLVKEHFEYWQSLYEKKILTQLVFTTEQSTFKAFSKAVASNLFGLQHENDPDKDKYAFLLMLDNDVIVLPKWDENVKQAWKHVHKNGMGNVKIIGQLPGGIKSIKDKIFFGKDLDGVSGSLGGSGFWTVRNNFFKDVGFLNLKNLVGHAKKHDQEYWALLSKKTNGKPYIVGLKTKLAVHCGPMAGSVCNILTRNRENPKKEDLIKFEEFEARIDKMSFEEFYEEVKNYTGW